MSYKITKGIPESALSDWLKKAAQRFGTFKDGRVDYTDADIAPIVLCTIKCGDELLLVKRGYDLADAEGYWSTVSGFIDDAKSVVTHVCKEIKEELGIRIMTRQVKVGTSYTLQNSKEKRKYIVFPCLVVLTSKPTIVLNNEHTNFTWIKKTDLQSYHTLDDLAYAIDAALAA